MPYPSAIFIRDKALVVNVESMRLIICQYEVLVLSVPDAEHPSQPAFPTPDGAFIKDLVQRVSEQKLSFASDHNLHVDTSLPYELRALEAVLARGVYPHPCPHLQPVACADLLCFLANLLSPAADLLCHLANLSASSPTCLRSLAKLFHLHAVFLPLVAKFLALTC